MPLTSCYQFPETKLALWTITESEAGLLQQFPFSVQELAFLKSESRRKSWLACRLALQQIAPSLQSIQKTSLGQPVRETNEYISFTHSEHFAMAAQSSFPLGIDIEAFSKPRNLRAATVFMNEAELSELAIQNQPKDWFLKVWTAKEAIFKLTQVRELSFRHQILIDWTAESVIFAKLDRPEFQKNIRLQWIYTEEWIACIAQANFF